MALALKPKQAFACRQAASVGPAPIQRGVRIVSRAQVAQKAEPAAVQLGRQAAILSVAASWMVSGNAMAAQELAMVAGDNRLSTLGLLFLPALGWVAFNILQPAFNQLTRMSEMNEEAAAPARAKRRGVAAGVGMGAALSLAAAQQADAAQEMAQLAADNRLSTLALLFLPALGWVAFNILQPAFNQLTRMSEKNEEAASGKRTKRRGVAAGLGLGAALSLAAAQQANAAQEMAQLAGDNRLSTLGLLFLPALGWVAFNILQPAFNQLTRMSEMNEEAAAPVRAKRRGVAGGLGLGAALSLAAAQQADAAQEMAQLAGDNRLSTLGLLFLPALGWVAFNILQPAFNQLTRMNEMNEEVAAPARAKRR